MTTTNRDRRKSETGFLRRLATRWGWCRARDCRPRQMDRALIAAHGKALTMLVTTLQARDLLDVEDFAGTLGVFSVVVGEDDPLEGDILAVWAGIMKESL